MPLSHTGKALFEALIGVCKYFGIEDYILSITTDNYIVNNRIVNCFKKHTLKSAEQGYLYEPPLTIFKVNDGHICCIAHSINLSAQAILTSLKSTAKKNTNILYNNTWFIRRALYTSAISKCCCITVRYCRLSLMRAAFARQCAAY